MKKIFLALISLVLLSFYVSAEEVSEKTDAVTHAVEKKEAAPVQTAEKAAPANGGVYEGVPITP